MSSIASPAAPVQAPADLCERYRLMSLPCTLDGKPALIAGESCPTSATVWQPGACRIQAQFSWPAVQRIMANGGQFNS